MLLKNKNAIVYGGGGAVGSAVARAFARQGARVFLAGRTRAKVEAIAREIVAAGGVAEAAEVDALDEDAVEKHASEVARSGPIDISYTAIAVPIAHVVERGMQGVPLAQMPLASFMQPIEYYLQANFLTARAVARRMLERGAGVILMHTPEPARLGIPLVGGMAPAWAAMESLSRSLSAELAARGIRVVTLRSTGLPETNTIEMVSGVHAKVLGISREQFAALLDSTGHTKRSTTLAEVANAAVFLASDLASGMTGTVANLTGGRIAD